MNEWNDLNPDDLLSLMEDIQDENEHLKKDNSEKQQQIYELSSEVSTLKTRMKEMQQKHQSERRRMTSVIDAQKEEMSKLQKDNQSLQRSNDDLRNNAGILTRDKVRAILNCNDELQEKYDRMTSETANLRRQVDMSSVRAVEEAGRCQQEAERRRLEALTLAQKERKAKQEAILRVEAERAELTRERLVSQRREHLSYGLVTAFLFASSAYHPVIWMDLRILLEPAADWITRIWICALLQPEGFSPIVRWICLLLLPAMICTVAVGMYLLLNRLLKQQSTLTVALESLSLAGIIYFGEYYPGNTALLLMEIVAMINLSKHLYDRHQSGNMEIVQGIDNTMNLN